jgi:hypothetical protein
MSTALNTVRQTAIDPAKGPVVFIANTAESFCDFVGRATDRQQRQQLLDQMATLGDRGLISLVDAKGQALPHLSVVSRPVQHGAYLAEACGYSGGHYCYPEQPSDQLSWDILQQPSLLAEIQAYSQDGQIQLVPHAATAAFYQLAIALQQRGLTVHLPESPAPEALWLRDYIDSKAGFRALAGQWLAQADRLLLAGMVSQTPAQAAAAVAWFHQRQQTAVVKADNGNDGLGQLIFSPGAGSVAAIAEAIQQNPFLSQDLLMVEQFVPTGQAGDRTSPSVELFVPPLGQPVRVTHVCNQLFLKEGSFSGALISRELATAPWHDALVDSGLTLGQRLQAWGYVGHFDLDAIADETGQLYLLEINARRTGSTHVHEFGCAQFGPDYLNHVALLSHTVAPCGSIRDFAILCQALGDLLYESGRTSGIAITHTSALGEGRFGYVAIAANTAAVLTLQQTLNQRLGC